MKYGLYMITSTESGVKSKELVEVSNDYSAIRKKRGQDTFSDGIRTTYKVEIINDKKK